MSFQFAITVFAAIFAIVNPIGNIPVFVAITQDYTPEQKSRVIRKVCIVAASVLFAFGIFGNYIFVLYGITIPAFKIAGGLLLFSIAFNMTRGQVGRGKITGEEHEEALEKEEVGVVPLGIPLFAGPGAITTVMIYISLATTSNDVAFDLSSIFLSIIVTIIASFLPLRGTPSRSSPAWGRAGPVRSPGSWDCFWRPSPSSSSSLGRSVPSILGTISFLRERGKEKIINRQQIRESGASMVVAEIRIELKQGVADPEGQNTRKALELLGFKGIKAFVRSKSSRSSWICLPRKQRSRERRVPWLLANPVIEIQGRDQTVRKMAIDQLYQNGA